MRRSVFGFLIMGACLLAAAPAEAQLSVQVALTWEYGDGGWHAYRPVYMPREAVYYTPSRRVRVPPGHMPRPGYCRLWLPDTPPGHQPPPQRCDRLFRAGYPRGAVIIGSPSHDVIYAEDRVGCDKRRGRGHGRKC
ncbi:MAG: hypothetical protein ABL963_03640 [Longimicrobiales bacterium]